MRLALWFAALALTLGFMGYLAGSPAIAQEADDAAPAPTTEAPAETGEEADAAADETPDAGEEEAASRLEVFIEKMKTTGVTGILLVIVSIFGLAFILERMFRLNRNVFITPGLVREADELWQRRKYDDLIERCKADDSALAAVIESIVRHRNVPATEVSVMAGDVGSRAIRRQHQKAYPLAVVSGLAPLLGLLGTVIGMVGAFETVAAVGSMGDPSVLADDISKALLTTAWGLSIAIPTLVAYHYFKTKTQNFGLVLEEQAGDLVSQWFHLDRATPVAPPEPPKAKDAAAPTSPKE